MKTLTDAKSKNRYLVNAIQVDGENSDPVILELTPTTFEKILDVMEEHGAEMLDLESGVDIIIERKGKGLNTEYSVVPAAKSKPVNKSVMANLNDLDAYSAQEYEQGLNKAMQALGAVAGRPMLTSGAASAFTGAKDKPKTTPKEDDGNVIDGEYSVSGTSKVLDDEIPFDTDGGESEGKASAATVIAAGAKAADDFNSELGADDIEDLLKDL